MPRVLLLCFCALLCTACGAPSPGSAGGDQPPSFDLAATRRLIEEQNRRFTAAHVAGDTAAIDAMFTEDARSYPPGADAAIGLPAIHALTVEYLKAGITEFREETTDFYGNGGYVVDAGTYVFGEEHSHDDHQRYGMRRGSLRTAFRSCAPWRRNHGHHLLVSRRSLLDGRMTDVATRYPTRCDERNHRYD